MEKLPTDRDHVPEIQAVQGFPIQAPAMTQRGLGDHTSATPRDLSENHPAKTFPIPDPQKQ